MKLHMEFSVIARCRVYEMRDQGETYTEDLELTLNKEDAMRFLFRFIPAKFALDGYKVYLPPSRDNTYNEGIVFIKDNNKYVVMNLNQLIADIHEGYFRLLSMDKISSILEYNFSSDEVSIEDEFS